MSSKPILIHLYIDFPTRELLLSVIRRLTASVNVRKTQTNKEQKARVLCESSLAFPRERSRSLGKSQPSAHPEKGGRGFPRP